MLTKKALISLISVLCVTLVAAGAAASYAWYKQKKTTEREFNVGSNSFIVIEITEAQAEGHVRVKPAIAMPNAVRDDKHIDVLRVYDPSEANPSFVSERATKVIYKFDFDLSLSSQVQEPDDPSPEPEPAVPGAPTLRPQDVTLSVTATMDYDSPRVPLTVGYADGEDKDVIIHVFGDITPTSAVSGVDDPEHFPITPDEPFRVGSSAHIKILLDVHLGKPDELYEPLLLTHPLLIGVKVRTSDSSD